MNFTRMPSSNFEQYTGTEFCNGRKGAIAMARFYELTLREKPTAIATIYAPATNSCQRLARLKVRVLLRSLH